MSLDKAKGFTKKALQHRRDARTLDKTNPSAAKGIYAGHHPA